MRTLAVMTCVCLVSSIASGQTTAGQGKADKVKEELRMLQAEYNDAGTKRDRAALGRLFADDKGQTTHVTLRIGSCQDTDAKKVL